jgi:hypothetical protein
MPLAINAAPGDGSSLEQKVQQFAVRTVAYILQQIFALSIHKTGVTRIYTLKHVVFILGMQTALNLSTANL